MKLIIDLPDEVKTLFDNADISDLRDFYDFNSTIGKAIKNGTPLPSNPTNGEMLMALFPNGNFSLGIGDDNVLMYFQTFDNEWWNAPYLYEDK